MNSKCILLAAFVALCGCTSEKKIETPEVEEYKLIKGSVLKDGQYFDNQAGFYEVVSEIHLCSNGDATIFTRTDTLGGEKVEAKWTRIGSRLTFSDIQSDVFTLKEITLPYEKVECGIKNNTNETRYIFNGFRILAPEGNFLRLHDENNTDKSFYLYYAKNKKLEPVASGQRR